MAQNLLTNRLGRYHLSINKESVQEHLVFSFSQIIKIFFFRSEEAYTVIISQWEIVFMNVMNEFCCDTSKIFCFNSLLSALTYLQICIKHASYCDEFSSEREKKEIFGAYASRSFLLGSKFLRKATRVLISLWDIIFIKFNYQG